MSSSNQPSSQKTQYFGVSNTIVEAQKESSVVHKSQERLASNRNSQIQSPGKNPLAAKANLRETVHNNGKALTG